LTSTDKLDSAFSLGRTQDTAVRRDGRLTVQLVTKWRRRTCMMTIASVGNAFWKSGERSWLRHCATSQKVAGSVPEGVTGILQ
jgi:hypothetical protein